MTSTIVAGANRRARLPGDEATPRHEAASAAPMPLVDSPEAPRLAPRKRSPSRVTPGPAIVQPAAAASTPAPAIVQRAAAASTPAPAIAKPAAASTPAPAIAKPAAASTPAPAASIQAPPASTAAPGPVKSARPLNNGSETRQQPARPLSKKPAEPRQIPQVTIARNAAVGLALAYMDRVSAQIGSPLAFTFRNLGGLIMALAHLIAPLGLAWLVATWNPATRELLLSGGLLPNAGKLVWLYLTSLFVWSLAYMGAARLLRAIRGDLTRFERIGSGAFTQKSKDGPG